MIRYPIIYEVGVAGFLASAVVVLGHWVIFWYVTMRRIKKTNKGDLKSFFNICVGVSTPRMTTKKKTNVFWYPP